MPYFSFRSFSCSSFFFVSIFWKAYDKRENMFISLEYMTIQLDQSSHLLTVSTYSVCVVVEDNQVAVADIEA